MNGWRVIDDPARFSNLALSPAKVTWNNISYASPTMAPILTAWRSNILKGVIRFICHVSFTMPSSNYVKETRLMVNAKKPLVTLDSEISTWSTTPPTKHLSISYGIAMYSSSVHKAIKILSSYHFRCECEVPFELLAVASWYLLFGCISSTLSSRSKWSISVIET